MFLAFAGLVFGQLTFVLVSGVGFGSLEDAQSLSARTQIQMILFMELGLVGAMLLTIGHMMFRAGATVSDLGFKTRHLGLDVRAGVGTFLLLAMPVLLLQGWLGKLFPEAGEHPLIELLRTDSALSTLLTFFCVVVVLAPIVEEFFFRVILQGWLERVGQGHISLRYRISSEGEETSQPALARTSPFEKLLNRDPVPQPDPMPLSHAWVSIVATSFLFALAHAGHGTAPIPLFIFSLGLGYVYQRTHTIWPSIVCHMLLNGFSFVQLVIDVTSKAHVAT